MPMPLAYKKHFQNTLHKSNFVEKWRNYDYRKITKIAFVSATWVTKKSYFA